MWHCRFFNALVKKNKGREKWVKNKNANAAFRSAGIFEFTSSSLHLGNIVQITLLVVNTSCELEIMRGTSINTIC